MGRIRTIKPEFHAHEELSALPPETHLFAGALVNYADDEGYFNANPVLVKAGTNPLRGDKTPISEQLTQLERIGYIEVRRCGLKHYGKVINFELHQRVSHATPSKIKSRFEELPKFAREAHENIPIGSVVKGIELNGIEQGTGNREAATAIAVLASPPRFTFLLTGRKTHIITQADLDSWDKAYPAVDVGGELYKIISWLDANEAKRSATGQGLRQRIVKWLTRAQDNGGSRGTQQRNFSKTGGNLDAAAQAIAFLEQADRDSQASDEVQPEPQSFDQPGDAGPGLGRLIDLRVE
jgi:hypothetical protein